MKVPVVECYPTRSTKHHECAGARDLGVPKLEIPAQDLTEIMHGLEGELGEFPEGPWLAYPGEETVTKSVRIPGKKNT